MGRWPHLDEGVGGGEGHCKCDGNMRPVDQAYWSRGDRGSTEGMCIMKVYCGRPGACIIGNGGGYAVRRNVRAGIQNKRKPVGNTDTSLVNLALALALALICLCFVLSIGASLPSQPKLSHFA